MLFGCATFLSFEFRSASATTSPYVKRAPKKDSRHCDEVTPYGRMPRAVNGALQNITGQGGRIVLGQHLNLYGIRNRFADDASYWRWAGQILGDKKAAILDQLREPLVQGTATKRELVQFYDFVADMPARRVVLSIKADAIRASAKFVTDYLPASGTVLDVGCHVGYLTTWYAKQCPSAHVIGLDLSSHAIDVARGMASQLNISNASFESGEFLSWNSNRTFTAIVDTQGLVCPGQKLEQAVEKVVQLLSPVGRFICVPTLGTRHEVEQLLAALHAFDLSVTTFDMLPHADLGEPSLYAALVAERQSSSEQSLTNSDVLSIFQRKADALMEQRMNQSQNADGHVR